MKEMVEFSIDKHFVTGTLFYPRSNEEDRKEKFPGVILFHGMTSSEKGYFETAEKLLDEGMIVLTINTRGHGSSDGNFHELTAKEISRDGTKIYDYLTKLTHIDKNKIGISGTSFGAIIACLTSNEREVQSLVLRVPAVYTDEMMNLTLLQTMKDEKEMFNQITEPEKAEAVKAITQFKNNLLVILSENDEILPTRITKSYYDEAKLADKREIIIIKDATHALTNPIWKEKYTDVLVNWFKKTLKD